MLYRQENKIYTEGIAARCFMQLNVAVTNKSGNRFRDSEKFKKKGAWDTQHGNP
jgi:hypothetical protein